MLKWGTHLIYNIFQPLTSIFYMHISSASWFGGHLPWGCHRGWPIFILWPWKIYWLWKLLCVGLYWKAKLDQVFQDGGDPVQLSFNTPLGTWYIWMLFQYVHTSSRYISIATSFWINNPQKYMQQSSRFFIHLSRQF